jgi:selenocysteine lyase/cysteine desulfurase
VRRIYLDHASTSWPKAPAVIDAMTNFMHENGASASRGNYANARRATAIRERVRHRLADCISAESPECISFHSGCTAALNAAIHGLLAAMVSPSKNTVGHHLIASAVEHNSVLRPLTAAAASADMNLEIIGCQPSGRVQVDAIVNAITDHTRLIALTDISNVTGIRQPVTELGQIIAACNATRAAEDHIILLCDAAQSFGYLPIDVSAMGVHVLAAPAHKGSGGPLGIAMLYLHRSLHDRIEPMMQGGSGHDGLADAMPSTMPARLEPGTMNIAALAGWNAALDRTAADDFVGLTHHLHDTLNSIDGLRVVGERGDLPIASVEFGDALTCSEAAAILDSEFGIEVRSGYHCAARLHDYLGTRQSGTLRISCGHGTTRNEIDSLAVALGEIIESIA